MFQPNGRGRARPIGARSSWAAPLSFKASSSRPTGQVSDVVGRKRLELEFPGNSLVCDPHGVVLAEGQRLQAGLVTADIDLDRARALARFAFR